ncbi:MAG: hypothetical protein QOH27_5003 [Mycobacterium sp.]|nr:hypothetical protein [Mycobacterium sp.]
MQGSRASNRLKFGYTALAALLFVWLTCLVAVALTAFVPQMYFFSYFSVDYTLGFARRGLAGELLDLFPADQYFTGLLTLRWLVSALFIVSLGAVAYTATVRFGRSERRLMLALLLPVLPFGFAFAIFCPHTDLLGAAALAAFAAMLGWCNEDRSIVLGSTAYGLITAILTLVHEAIPVLFSLGAILAIVVLTTGRSVRVQRLCAVVAVAPGLVITMTTVLLGRHGITSELCALVPHRLVDWPAAGNLTMGQMLSGQHSYVDYNDWVCRVIIKRLDQTPTDASRFVASIGAGPLIAMTVFGIIVFALTIVAIRRISGVPFRRFCAVVRPRITWVLLAILLIVPAFATAVDWIRWWVTISFDVGVVYLLYVSSQPEAAQPPSRRTRVLFVVGGILLALLPIGIIPNVGIPIPV